MDKVKEKLYQLLTGALSVVHAGRKKLSIEVCGLYLF